MRDFFAESGLNLFAVLETDGLPEEVAGVLRDHVSDFDSFRRLVLVGHAGRALWESLSEDDFAQNDPVDTYSVRVAQEACQRFLLDAAVKIVYPFTEMPLPLHLLGQAAGWNQTSPLGIGIHETFGLWHAYRVVFLTSAELAVDVVSPSQSPCDTCVGKPCISVCPAKAVQIAGFDVETCCQFRITGGSVCSKQCLARLACPVGAEHRYSAEQIAYHYGLSLETIHKYFHNN